MEALTPESMKLTPIDLKTISRLSQSERFITGPMNRIRGQPTALRRKRPPPKTTLISSMHQPSTLKISSNPMELLKTTLIPVRSRQPCYLRLPLSSSGLTSKTNCTILPRVFDTGCGQHRAPVRNQLTDFAVFAHIPKYHWATSAPSKVMPSMF
jgi:hypothetical protein